MYQGVEYFFFIPKVLKERNSDGNLSTLIKIIEKKKFTGWKCTQTKSMKIANA